MCRSIKTLRGQAPTDDEIRAAALQYIRKVSGYRVPSKANADAFNAAVEAVASVSAQLLEALPATPGPAPRPSSGPRPARATPR